MLRPNTFPLSIMMQSCKWFFHIRVKCGYASVFHTRVFPSHLCHSCISCGIYEEGEVIPYDTTQLTLTCLSVPFAVLCDTVATFLSSLLFCSKIRLDLATPHYSCPGSMLHLFIVYLLFKPIFMIFHLFNVQSISIALHNLSLGEKYYKWFARCRTCQLRK